MLREHCYDLYLFNLTTGNKTFLHRYVPPVDDLIIPEFAWSADSRWLRLTSQWDRDGLPRSDLFAVPPGAPRVAAAAFRLAGYEVLEAVYSPGRQQVVVAAERGDEYSPTYDGSLFLCHPDGSHRQRVTRFTSGPGVHNSPANSAKDWKIWWLPSGQGFLFYRMSGHGIVRW